MPSGDPAASDSRRNGSNSDGTSSGGISGPPLATSMNAMPVAGAGRHLDPAVRDVVPDRVVDQVGDQPLDQHRIAQGGPGPRAACTVTGRARMAGAAASSASSASTATSSGSRGPVPRSLRASVSSASISASARSAAWRTSTAIASSCAGVRPGLASVTSIAVRITVSGVRSSCEALATKRRWLAKAASSRAEHGVEGVRQFLQLVVGPGQRDPLAQVLLRGPARRRGDGVHRPQRPARRRSSRARSRPRAIAASAPSE